MSGDLALGLVIGFVAGITVVWGMGVQATLRYEKGNRLLKEARQAKTEVLVLIRGPRPCLRQLGKRISMPKTPSLRSKSRRKGMNMAARYHNVTLDDMIAYLTPQGFKIVNGTDPATGNKKRLRDLTNTVEVVFGKRVDSQGLMLSLPCSLALTLTVKAGQWAKMLFVPACPEI